MDKDIKKGIFEWLNKNQQKIEQLSDEIWGYAELPMQEVKSANALSNWLQREGFQVTRGTSGMPTAFVAEYRSGSGSPKIIFLAEYDALAGNSNKIVPRHEPIVEGGSGHGCGHNIIGTADTAAAIALKNEMVKRKMGS